MVTGASWDWGVGAGLTLDTSRVGQNSILLIIEILSRPGLQSVRQWPAKDNGEWRHCTDVLLSYSHWYREPRYRATSYQVLSWHWTVFISSIYSQYSIRWIVLIAPGQTISLLHCYLSTFWKSSFECVYIWSAVPAAPHPPSCHPH